MLYYDRNDFSEGRIDVNKTSKKKFDTCHYWYFIDIGVESQPYLCTGCHDVLTMSMSLSSIVLLNIEGADFCCIIGGISKNEAIHYCRKLT